eukprot:6457700-Amphidinium_carterae.1
MGSSESRERERQLANVKSHGHLGRVPERSRADREIVLSAVQENGLALQYAAEECKADHQIVMAAVTQHG